MSGLRRLMHAVVSTPWAIVPERLDAIMEVLEFQAAGGQLSTAEIQARVGPGRAAGATAPAGIAVLPVHGIIGHRMNQIQDVSGPGGTSTEQFSQWFDAALADPGVSAIVLDVDSPGGTIAGVMELGAKIYKARGQKPIVAIANDMAASAAYWLATAAEEVWVTPSGDVGNIGVYAIHVDRSARNDQLGVRRTYVSAGRYKVEGNPDEALSDEAREAMQGRVDAAYDAFTTAVARHRGVEQSAVIEGFGEGRLIQAKPALRLGMVDTIGTMEDLLTKLGAGRPAARTRLAAMQAAPAARAAAEPLLHLPLAAGPAGTDSMPAAGVAAAPAVVPIHEPAPVAKELRMSDTDKAAAAAVATDADGAKALKLENTRRDGLLALGQEYDQPVSRIRGWIESNISVEAAQKDLMAELKDQLRRAPSARVHQGGDQGTDAGPFRTLGEQLAAVVEAGRGRVDPRLLAVMEHAGPTGASASVGSDGGYLIQKDFAADLVKEGTETGVLASRCSTTEIGADSDGLEVVYVDETSRVNGSRWGGVQVYRRDEADTVTATKPKLDKWECRLEDLMGLAYVTDRLMKDATALGSVFSEAFRDEFGFKVDDEIFRGSGVGQCFGVTTHASLVTQAKEGSQANDTIVGANVIKMWSRVHPRSRLRGAWFVNVECDPQLLQMNVPVKNVAGTENVGGQLIYMPPGGVSGSQYGSIFGRPVIPIEHASALGDVGDITFLDLSQYKLITKGGIEEDESIHVRFLYAEKVMRWITRINGQPKPKAPLTPYKGTATLSPFVALQAR